MLVSILNNKEKRTGLSLTEKKSVRERCRRRLKKIQKCGEIDKNNRSVVKEKMRFL